MKTFLNKNKKLLFIALAELLLVLAPLLYIPFAPSLELVVREEEFIRGEEDVRTPELSLPYGIYAVQVDYLSEEDGGEFSWTVNTQQTDFHSFHGDTFRLFNDHTEYHFHIWADAPAKGLQGVFTHSDGADALHPQLLRICSTVLTWTRLSVLLFALVLIADLIAFYRVWIRNKDILTRLVPLFILLITAAGCILLAKYGCTGQRDMDSHLYRIDGIKDGLLAGQFPVKVQPNWMNNYGYAEGVFYGDFFLWPAVLLRFAGFTLTDAYRFYIFMMTLGCALFAYLAFKYIAKSRVIGLACSLTYTLAQYRLVDIFYRGAVGEYSAITFFPLVVWGLYIILTESPEEKMFRRGYLIAACGYSVLILTHILSCEMAGIFTILLCLMSLKQVFQKPRFIELVKTVGTTILASLWFLLPFLDFYLRDKFLVNDGSRDGYVIQHGGTQLQRIFSPIYPARDGELPAVLGGALSLILVLSALLLLALRKKDREQETVKGAGRVCLLALLAVWMSTNTFPYDALRAIPPVFKLLTTIQFPWRFFGLASLLITFLLAWLCTQLKAYSEKLIYPIALSLLSLLALFQGVAYQAADDFFSDLTTYFCDTIGVDSFCQVNGEYVPSGSDWAYYNRPYVYNLDGGVYVSDYEIGKGYVRAVVTAGEGGNICIPMVWYRGYEARDINTGERFEVVDGWNRLVEVKLPAGYSGILDIRYRGLWYWRIGEVISLLFIAGVAGNIQLRRNRLRRREAGAGAAFSARAAGQETVPNGENSKAAGTAAMQEDAASPVETNTLKNDSQPAKTNARKDDSQPAETNTRKDSDGQG